MNQAEVIEVQFYPWDRSYFFDPAGYKFQLGDRVIVETTVGQDMGKIVGFGRVTAEETEEPLKPILRTPTLLDLEQVKKYAAGKQAAFDTCRQLVKKHGLPMKIFDVAFSFDGKRIVFAFISSTRVDFRELVKDLSMHFNRTIRLQQIGSRDVVAEMGGIGPCGRQACCTAWLGELGNISSELIPLQQLEFRGSDRLSGLCGRLKCCLTYESEGYRLCAEKMPETGAVLKTKSYGVGTVLNRNVLRHTITFKTEKENKIVEIALGCKKVGCSGCSANCNRAA